MRTLIDNESGSIVFIPDNDADRRLLFHLLNCSDLSRFTNYLSLEQKIDPHTVTLDIGVSADMMDDYPVCTVCEESIPSDIGHTQLGRLVNHPVNLNIPPKEECEPYATLLDENKKLIGFCRDSKQNGYKFKPVKH